MGRPKDFPVLFQDLIVKYKSKAIADREYKTYMLLAKEPKLTKDAKLSDIKPTDKVDVTATKVEATATKHISRDEQVKKQRLVEPPAAVGGAGGGVRSSEKVLYERLVEAERLRAEAEKQRGDDLSKIAMMLASGKGGDIIPQSPPAAADKSPSKISEPDRRDEEQTSQQHNKHNSQPTTQNREARTKAKHDKHAVLLELPQVLGLSPRGRTSELHQRFSGHNMESSSTAPLICMVILLALGPYGATASLDDTCGLPLLKAHYACQDIMNGMAANTTARRAQRLSLVAATGLPGNASCCDALVEVFSPQWQTTCACREDMRDQTTAQPASAMKKLARLASAMCPSSVTAPKPWTWQRCSLGNSTGHGGATVSTPGGVTSMPAAASAQVSALTQAPDTFGPAVVSTTPAHPSWEDVLSAAGGITGRKLLQSCTTSNCFTNPGMEQYGCPIGYGRCNGNTCTFGSAYCPYTIYAWGISPSCCFWSGGGYYGEVCQRPSWVCCQLSNCVACFPGSATVTLESGEKRPMSRLAIGDRVQVVDPTSGKVRFEEVYLFGHQLSDVSATFVKATLANGRVLTLSPDHFVPAVPMGKPVVFKSTVMMRGKDLLAGMHVFTADAEGSAASMVKHIGVSAEQGLFNPYTMGGLIVVDGVVASAHSSWVFDSVMDLVGLTHKIPALYQALFAPVRMLYRMLGAARMSSIAPSITDFGNALAQGEWATVGRMACNGLGVLLSPALAGASVFAAYHVAAQTRKSRVV